MDDVLHVDIDGPVATVWLNRPHVRNALSALLIGGLRETIVALDANADIGAIVLTGADPAFCAGLDLSEVAAGSVGGGGAGLPIPADLGTPVIGAINAVPVGPTAHSAAPSAFRKPCPLCAIPCEYRQ